MYDSFKAAINAAPNEGAPASPLGNFPEINAYNKAAFMGPVARFGAAGLGQASVADFNKQQQDAQDAAKQQASDLQKKIQELSKQADPKNYQVVSKQDGGFDYLDGAGKKITLSQYTRVTGTDPVKVLSQSSNAKDQQYVNDYNNLQQIVNAALNNDRATLMKIGAQLTGNNAADKNDKNAQAANQASAEDFVNKILKMKPGDLIQQFVKYYPNVYTDHAWNQYQPGTSGTHSPGQFPQLGF